MNLSARRAWLIAAALVLAPAAAALILWTQRAA